MVMNTAKTRATFMVPTVGEIIIWSLADFVSSPTYKEMKGL